MSQVKTAVKPRGPLHTLRSKASPHIAGMIYDDPILGLVLHSIRRNGIHEKTNSIQFAVDVLDQAMALNCGIVRVETNGQTYTAAIATIRAKGRYVTTSTGVQLALHLKWWSTNGIPLVEEQPATHAQLSIFEGA